jgi:hypothetical protein
MTAAFDIGVKNFAFAVKKGDDYIILKNLNLSNKVSKSELNKLKKSELVEMLEQPPKSEMKKKELVDALFTINKKQKSNDVCTSLLNNLDEYKHIWDDCNVFLIERQKSVNLQALKLSHYLEAYLKIHYSEKKILNYNASLKTKKLGAINLKTKLDRKKWTIEFASTILKDENLKYYTSLPKKDDVADVVCMIESFES